MTIECLKGIVTEAGGWDRVIGLIFHDAVIWVKEFINSPLKESDFKEIGGTWCFVETLRYRDKRTYEYTIEAKDYHDINFLMHVITAEPEARKNMDVAAYNDLARR